MITIDNVKILLVLCLPGTSISIFTITSIILTLSVICNYMFISVKYVHYLFTFLLFITSLRFAIYFEIITNNISLYIYLFVILIIFILVKTKTINPVDIMQQINTYIYGTLVIQIPVLNWYLFLNNVFWLNMLNLLSVEDIYRQRYKALMLVSILTILYSLSLMRELFFILIFLWLLTLVTDGIKARYNNNIAFRNNFNANIIKLQKKENELKTRVTSAIKYNVIHKANMVTSTSKTVLENKRAAILVTTAVAGFLFFDCYDSSQTNRRLLDNYETECKEYRADYNKRWNEINKTNNEMVDSYYKAVAEQTRKGQSVLLHPQYLPYPEHKPPVAPNFTLPRVLEYIKNKK